MEFDYGNPRCGRSIIDAFEGDPSVAIWFPVMRIFRLRHGRFA
jgi:hypothetical protein